MALRHLSNHCSQLGSRFFKPATPQPHCHLTGVPYCPSVPPWNPEVGSLSCQLLSPGRGPPPQGISPSPPTFVRSSCLHSSGVLGHFLGAPSEAPLTGLQHSLRGKTPQVEGRRSTQQPRHGAMPWGVRGRGKGTGPSTENTGQDYRHPGRPACVWMENSDEDIKKRTSLSTGMGTPRGLLTRGGNRTGLAPTDRWGN